MILASHHPEILGELKKIVKISNEYKRYVQSLGSGVSRERGRSTPDEFYNKVLDFNKENGGTLKKDIQSVVLGLGCANPEFYTIQGMSRTHLEQYVKVTDNASVRMRNQLMLMKILEVKNIFKYESDIFKPQNITRVEALLKELK